MLSKLKVGAFLPDQRSFRRALIKDLEGYVQRLDGDLEEIAKVLREEAGRLAKVMGVEEEFQQEYSKTSGEYYQLQHQLK